MSNKNYIYAFMINNHLKPEQRFRIKFKEGKSLAWYFFGEDYYLYSENEMANCVQTLYLLLCGQAEVIHDLKEPSKLLI